MFAPSCPAGEPGCPQSGDPAKARRDDRGLLFSPPVVPPAAMGAAARGKPAAAPWQRTRFFPKLAPALALLLALGAPGVARADCADVALVMAIDASGSVKVDEFALQQQGYATALRSPRVQSAIAAAGIVEIGVILWGDTESDLQILPLTRLADAAAVEELARRMEAMPRKVSGNTGLGRAVWSAIGLLEEPGTCAYRRLINVSGDGLETVAPYARAHVPLAQARQRAEELGITINALAIQTDVADLGQWYRDRLATGPGAFVMEVQDFGSFAEAIEEKLAREIAPPAVASLQDVRAAEPLRATP